jgi:hypothetical protein
MGEYGSVGASYEVPSASGGYGGFYSVSAGSIGSNYGGSSTYYPPSLCMGSYLCSSARQYSVPLSSQNFEAGLFLNPNRPQAPFVTCSEEVKAIIEETFEKITGQELPEAIQILVCPIDQFKSLHSEFGPWNEGIMGFSLNKFGRGVSEIYVRQAQLDSLMLTVGHELGHVLSPTLLNAHDEEAKAHAFSLAWMNTIRDNNIADLKSNIALNPANNGLHDVAFNFVTKLLHTGASPFDIFETLSKGLTSILAA